MNSNILMISEKDDLLINPIGLLIITVILLAMFLYIFDFNYLDLSGNDDGNKHVTFFVLFEFNIRAVFKAQSPETMSIIINGVHTVMRKHVERPAVLLFLAPTDAYFTAISLARTLVKAVLVSFGRQWSLNDLDKIFLKGTRFSVIEDYWRFHKKLMKRIGTFSVVVVEKFEALHPQVSTVFCNIADDTYSPFPRCLIILIIDVNDYFTPKALATQTSIAISESYLKENFGPFVDEEALNDLMRIITGRSVVIKREKHLENM